MNMCRCPHCGEEGITALRKLNLGPALPTTCEHCGKKVGVPWWSIITILPAIAGISISGQIQSSVIAASAATIMTYTTCCLFESFVPLIKK
jgi:hypothetical protein